MKSEFDPLLIFAAGVLTCFEIQIRRFLSVFLVSSNNPYVYLMSKL